MGTDQGIKERSGIGGGIIVTGEKLSADAHVDAFSGPVLDLHPGPRGLAIRPQLGLIGGALPHCQEVHNPRHLDFALAQRPTLMRYRLAGRVFQDRYPLSGRGLDDDAHRTMPTLMVACFEGQ
jgi:hypothetical protein